MVLKNILRGNNKHSMDMVVNQSKSMEVISHKHSNQRVVKGVNRSMDSNNNMADSKGMEDKVVMADNQIILVNISKAIMFFLIYLCDSFFVHCCVHYVLPILAAHFFESLFFSFFVFCCKKAKDCQNFVNVLIVCQDLLFLNLADCYFFSVCNDFYVCLFNKKHD